MTTRIFHVMSVASIIGFIALVLVIAMLAYGGLELLTFAPRPITAGTMANVIWLQLGVTFYVEPLRAWEVLALLALAPLSWITHSLRP